MHDMFHSLHYNITHLKFVLPVQYYNVIYYSVEYSPIHLVSL